MMCVCVRARMRACVRACVRSLLLTRALRRARHPSTHSTRHGRTHSDANLHILIAKNRWGKLHTHITHTRAHTDTQTHTHSQTHSHRHTDTHRHKSTRTGGYLEVTQEDNAADAVDEEEEHGNRCIRAHKREHLGASHATEGTEVSQSRHLKVNMATQAHANGGGGYGDTRKRRRIRILCIQTHTHTDHSYNVRKRNMYIHISIYTYFMPPVGLALQRRAWKDRHTYEQTEICIPVPCHQWSSHRQRRAPTDRPAPPAIDTLSPVCVC